MDVLQLEAQKEEIANKVIEVLKGHSVATILEVLSRTKERMLKEAKL